MTPQVKVFTLAFDEAMPGFDDGAVTDFVGSSKDDPARTAPVQSPLHLR